ncbi:MAG: DUF4124 domain-containing protein [Xanthomonadaceae bacterium]|nr:DUF4124 domain-containing protein [Xanthomonadaceae bacterium]
MSGAHLARDGRSVSHRAPRLARDCARPLPKRALAALLFCAYAASAAAQTETVIYRCTDPAGNVMLQNDRPCPKGHTQDIRMVGTLPTSPSPATAPAAAAASRPPATPAPAAAPPTQPQAPTATETPARAAPTQPPPALYQCKTWDDREYLGDTEEPASSCAPLQTVGIDGSPDLGAGSACEMRRDACVPIAPDQLCRTWKRRVDEAEFRWKFAGSRNDERKAEFERFAKIYRESACVR